MAGNWFSNTVSSIGQALNAPVIFDWDTDAARQDARTGAVRGGDVKRSVSSTAGQAAIDETVNMPKVLGGFRIQTPGAVGAPQSSGITDIADTYTPGGSTTVNGVTYSSAAAAQAAKQNQVRSNIQATQQGYTDAARQGITDTANKYRNDVNAALNQYEDGVATVNTGKTNNALNLRRSMAGIANGVRTGLKSGGVTLANMNATDSGAADAMARAYAEMGNQQSGDANNEATLKENELNTNLATLNRNKDQTIGALDAQREAEKERVRGDFHTKLALLDQSGQADGVTGAVNMDLVNQILNEAVSRLSEIDNGKNARLSGIRGLDADEVNRKAAEMDAAGREGTSPFSAGNDGISFTGQDSIKGANISQLPIFARKQDQEK